MDLVGVDVHEAVVIGIEAVEDLIADLDAAMAAAAG